MSRYQPQKTEKLCRGMLAVIMALMLWTTGIQAQQLNVVPTAATSTSAGGTFTGLAASARTYQWLINENQLTNLVGMEITGISFRISTSASSTGWPTATTTYSDYDIYLSESVTPANRSLALIADNIVGTQTQVRSGSLTLNPGHYPGGAAATLKDFGDVITFNTPYLYMGGHLLVEVRHSGHDGASPPSTDAVLATGGSIPGYGTDFSACWIGSYTGTSSASQGNFVAIQFTSQSSGPCTAPPTAGTASSSPLIHCAGENINLTLSGNSTGSGQTYQWQSSPTGSAPWTNVDTPRLSPAFSTPSTTDLYYRCEVTCSGQTDTSTVVYVTPSPNLPAGTYTINSAVATGGTNFQSFTDAVAALSCGIAGPIVFDVAPGSGPYNEQITIPEILNASSTNTITFNGNGNTLTFAGISSLPYTLGLNGADYFTFKDLTITGTDATYSLTVHLWGGADNNTFNNLTINSNGSATGTIHSPFSISGTATSVTGSGNSGSGNTLSNSTLNGGYYGVALYGATATIGSGNQILNNTIKDFYAYGVYHAYNNGTLVKGNVIERPTRTNSTTVYGVYLTTSSTNFTADGNRIRNFFDGFPTGTSTAYGLGVAASATAGNENRFINNLVTNIESASGTAAGIYIPSYNYIAAYHNTIVLNRASSTAGITYGIYLNGTGTEAKNNQITIARGGTGTKYGIYHSGATSTSDYNNFHITSPAGTNNVGYRSTAYATLAAFQAGTGLDMNSSDVDPLYANPGAGVYEPTNLAVNNTGTPVGVTHDINNTSRNLSAPDIGAYEFVGVVTAVDLAADALVAPAATSCYTASETVTVRIRNFHAQAVDFSVNPITVSGSVDGVNPVAFTPVVVNTGTLDPDSTLSVTLSVNYDMSALGTYTYSFNVSSSADLNHFNDSLSGISRNFSVGSIASSYDEICGGTSFDLKIDSFSGPVQWQSYDDVNSVWVNETGTGSTSTTYAVTPSATTLYRALACTSYPSAVDTVVPLIVVPPTVTYDTVCSGQTAQLIASGVGDKKWYSVATGGNSLSSGDTLSLVVNTDTTLYVEAQLGGGGGNIPELIYYKFDDPGTTVANLASNPVGNNPAPVIGLTIGGTGQFGTGLQGNAGPTATNRVNVGWTGTHTGSWTISFWMNVPTPPTTRYMFGNTSGSLFRCFIGGAAVGIRLTGGTPSITLDMPSWTPGIHVITYVYDQTVGTVSGYIDGIFQASATPGSSYPIVGTDFVVGSQATSIEGIMDEFRMYSRALSAAEVAATWDSEFGGCASSRIPVPVTVKPSPVVNLGADTTQCEGTRTLDAANAGSNFVWNTTETTQSIIAASAGTYSVTVTSANGCTGSDAVNVNIVPYPDADLGSDTSLCGGFLILSTSVLNNSFQWSTGSTSPFITVTSTGTYGVTVTTPEGCASSDTVDIAVNPPATLTLADDTAQCGGSVTLDANAATSYEWNTGDVTQTLTVSQTGTYSVVITDANNCTATDSVVVTIHPIPVIDLGNDISQCGGTVNLDAGNAGSTYLWSNNLTAQSIIVINSGEYFVKVTSPDGCESSDTVNVAINLFPVVNLGADVTQCEGTVTLDAGNAGSTYLWSNSATSQSIVVNASGEYVVEVTSPENCTSSDTVKVMINANPTITFTAADTVCEDAATITLSASPSGGTFAGTGVIGNSFNPNTAGAGTHTVTYSYTDGNGCSATASESITVEICTGITEAGEEVTFAIFPNPTSGTVYINFTSKNVQSVNVEVFAADGKLVQAVNNLQSGNAVNLENAARGLFTFRITAEGLSVVKRIVVE